MKLGVRPLRPSQTANQLFGAEVIAARIEAALYAQPEVGRLWRSEVSLLEAVSSASLEDVRIKEADLLRRIAHEGIDETDPRAVDLASTVLRVLRTGIDPFQEPVRAFRRIEAAAAPVGRSREEASRVSDEDILKLIAATRELSATPILAGLYGAARYAVLSEHHSPVAERLVFSMIEGAMRQTSSIDRDNDTALEPIFLGSGGARWICSPAIALSRQGYRVWAPLSQRGVAEFVSALSESLLWDLGQLATTRHVVEQIRRAAAGRRSHGSDAAFARMIAVKPIITSGMVMSHLGVTRPTALRLIDDFTELGVLRLLTPRRRARIWGLSSVAGRLEGAIPATGRNLGAIGSRGAKPRGAEEEASIERTLASVGDVLSEVDSLLAKFDLPAPGGAEEDDDWN